MYDPSDLSARWQQRFDFYDRYGLPTATTESRQAFSELTFWDKAQLNSNVLAFLCGPIYFFVKGMWRKGLVLSAAALALGVTSVALGAPEMVDRAASLVVPALAMTTANYAYYLHVANGSRSWNPLEGFLRRSARHDASPQHARR